MNWRQLKIDAVCIVSVLAICGIGKGRAASLSSPDHCDVSDLSAVFRDPLRYQGVMFCGKAFFNTTTLAFYDQPAETVEQRTDVALVPAEYGADTTNVISELGMDEAVTIRARLQPDVQCILGASDPDVVCSPFRRPIFISNFFVQGE